MAAGKSLSERIALAPPWIGLVLLAATFLFVALSSQSPESAKSLISGIAMYANFAWWLIFVAAAERTLRLHTSISSGQMSGFATLFFLGMSLLVFSMPPILLSAINHEGLNAGKAEERFFSNASVIALQLFVFVFLYFCLKLASTLGQWGDRKKVRGVLLFLAIVYAPIGQFLVRSRLSEIVASSFATRPSGASQDEV